MGNRECQRINAKALFPRFSQITSGDAWAVGARGSSSNVFCSSRMFLVLGQRWHNINLQFVAVRPVMHCLGMTARLVKTPRFTARMPFIGVLDASRYSGQP